MFMEEDPFAKSNSFYKNRLRNNANGRIVLKLRRALEILREDGVGALLKKVWGKVSAL